MLLAENCKICILGDSLVEHDGWVGFLRALLAKRNVQVFNRGIGGNRACMAKALLEDEIFWLNPDYVVVTYGVNDLGIWLYDARLEASEELVQKRRARIEEYKKGLQETASALRERGIQPILFSPVPVNENLPSVISVQTHGDNAEKGDLITPEFYTRESMQNVNSALEDLTNITKALAKEEGYLFFDVFHLVKGNLLQKMGCYQADGIHLTTEGHWVLTQTVLPFFGYQEMNKTYKPEIGKTHNMIKKINGIERAVQLFRWGFYHPCTGKYTEDDIVAKVKRLSQDQASEEWLKLAAKNFLEYRNRLSALRKELAELHTAFIAESKSD